MHTLNTEIPIAPQLYTISDSVTNFFLFNIYKTVAAFQDYEIINKYLGKS